MANIKNAINTLRWHAQCHELIPHLAVVHAQHENRIKRQLHALRWRHNALPIQHLPLLRRAVIQQRHHIFIWEPMAVQAVKIPRAKKQHLHAATPPVTQ